MRSAASLPGLGRPAIAHFGLGGVEVCDLHVALPSRDSASGAYL